MVSQRRIFRPERDASRAKIGCSERRRDWRRHRKQSPGCFGRALRCRRHNVRIRPIVGVEDDSPAGRGGIIVGDILIGVGGEPVRDTDDLRAALGPDVAGQPATLKILRGGELRELTITIGER